MTPGPGDITVLLQRSRDPHNREDRQELFRQVERELRAIAAKRRRQLSPTSSLQTTELIDDAFMRLVNIRRIEWAERGEFFRVAHGVIRRILCDQLRSSRRRRQMAPLDSNDLPDKRCPAPDAHYAWQEMLQSLLEALGKLEQEDAVAAQVFELRFFGGRCLVLGATPGEWNMPDAKADLLPFSEVAKTLGIPRSSAFAHWSRAVDRLKAELRGFAPAGFHEATHGH
jgi:RNA polymerase sigma factor (TIGR02999 family)